MKFVALALLLLAAVPAPQDDAGARDRGAKFGAAIAAVRSGDLEGGHRQLDALLADYDQRFAGDKRAIYCGFAPAETLLYMGMAAAAKRDAIAVEPNWCMALWAKGYAYAEARRFDLAVDYLQRALAKAPHHAQFLAELGYVYGQTRQWQKAIDVYQQAYAHAALAPEGEKRWKGTALRGIGFAEIEQGEWDKAQATFKRALELDPADAKAKGELDYIARHRKATG